MILTQEKEAISNTLKDDPDVRFSKGYKSLVIEGKYDQNKGRLQKHHRKEETQTSGTSSDESTKWSDLSTLVPTGTPTEHPLHGTAHRMSVGTPIESIHCTFAMT